MFSFGFEHSHVADRMLHRVAESDLQAGSARSGPDGWCNFPTFRCDPIRTGPVLKGLHSMNDAIASFYSLPKNEQKLLSDLRDVSEGALEVLAETQLILHEATSHSGWFDDD
jgi:hypothetical protein